MLAPCFYAYPHEKVHLTSTQYYIGVVRRQQSTSASMALKIYFMGGAMEMT